MDDRSASMLELKALHVPHGHYDVAVLGGGLAGLSMAIQLKRARPETRVLVTDKRTEPAPEAAFKVGESSVEVGRALLPRSGRDAGSPRAGAAPQARPPVSPACRRQQRHHEAGRVLHARAPRGLHAPDRSRALRERALPALPEARRRGVSRLARAGRRDRHRRAHHQAQPGGRGDERHGPLGRRRERPREHPAPQARPRGRHRPPHQRGLDPPGRRPRLRGLDRRRGMAEPDAGAWPAPALDHPPDRRGLLAVADPARLGPDQHRCLRRSARPPVGGDRELRRVHGVDEGARAAGLQRDRRASRGRARLPAREGLLLRVRRGSSRRIAGRWSGRRVVSSTPSTPPARTSSPTRTRSATS